MHWIKEQIEEHNNRLFEGQQEDWSYLQKILKRRKIDANWLLKKIVEFQVAIPSWALGAGGTRFGRFPIGGEPATLMEKLDDIGMLNAINGSSGAISLHIPWDIPENVDEIRAKAKALNIKFDAMNSNTFQDQEDQEFSYKHGSLSHSSVEIRQKAIDHNLEVIEYGKALGSKALTVWLADGSCFPGQQNFKKAFQRTLNSLSIIYDHIPEDWRLLIEYKPYEPNYYSTVIQDWGASHMLASKLGPKAKTLVDLGHHLPNANIEQIVAYLIMENKLGGFHFNDSKYGDDDLTVGSLKPYQLFLIFNELVEGMEEMSQDYAWMIDASHNIKDPLEDLLQSVEAILLAYAQALCIDREALENARENNDASMAQEILQDAYRIDLRPLLQEARRLNQNAIAPIKFYRDANIRKTLIEKRGLLTQATGL